MEEYRLRLYDALYASKDYRAEAAQVEAAIRARAPRARSLLDVACGTGGHLEHLRTRFDLVAGVDLSAEQLEVARERLPGAPLEVADMVELDLGRRYDAVTCLFSSIGYVGSEGRLQRAVARMAAHLEPGGVLVVEPWLEPHVWRDGDLHLLTVDEPELKIARVTRAGREGDVSVMTFHYLAVTPTGADQFVEEHRAALFTREQYLAAFGAAGLDVEHDPDGLTGRGLYVGVWR